MNVNDLAKEILASKNFERSRYRWILRSNVFGGGLQNIHTPFDLCKEILDKLNEYCNIRKQRSILVLFNVEFLDVLVNDFGVKPERITFAGDSKIDLEMAKCWYGVKDLVLMEYKKGEVGDAVRKLKRQFDVVVQNPPYQAPQNKNKDQGRGRTGSTLWDRFIPLAIDLLNDNGHLVSINPSGWRLPHNPLWKKMRAQLLFLSMHSRSKGVKTFGQQTRFDCVVLQKGTNISTTKVVDENGKSADVDLRVWPFLPNHSLSEFERLVAKDGEERTNLLHSESDYEIRRPWMNREKKGKFRHPCVYTVNVNSQPTFFYSSSKEHGHFGIPKVIFSTGGVGGCIVDANGEFGLTQFARGIVENLENLPLIQKALLSDRWKSLRTALFIAQLDISKHAFACLRKDFWKEFI